MSARARSRYAQGRTTVHEVGHYLGLRHTWGDAIEPLTPDGCFLDDYIDDTPNNEAAFANQITDRINNPCDTSINSCYDPYLGRDYPDMFENYMDYSGDQCYNLFTKQQVDFMRFILTTKRAGIITKREIESIPTAINNLKLRETGISFYPNPATNNITVSVEKPLKSSISVNLIDVTGKIVSSQLLPNNIMNHSLDVSSLANGIYMIQFSNQEFTAIDKFVKE